MNYLLQKIKKVYWGINLENKEIENDVIVGHVSFNTNSPNHILNFQESTNLKIDELQTTIEELENRLKSIEESLSWILVKINEL